MMGLIAAIALLAQGVPWTWSLYEGDGPVVLAEEVPDTPRLKSTLQCDRGSNVVRVTLYDSGLAPGFVTLTSAEATATAEAAAGRADSLGLALPTDHPVFARFTASGTLNVASGGAGRTLTLDGLHLAKLRRFAELCTG